MLNRRALLALLLIAGVVLLAPACKKKSAEVTPPPPPQETPAPAPKPTPPPKEVKPDYPTEKPTPKPVEPSIDELNRQGVLRTVYFDFDKSDLTNDTRQVLRSNADWLKTNANYNVVIEGHCDERGSIEYNLALGERRANAVRDYLASLGVTVSRMRIVSYGEERPADPGHNESAWAKNRRAQFVIER